MPPSSESKIGMFQDMEAEAYNDHHQTVTIPPHLSNDEILRSLKALESLLQPQQGGMEVDSGGAGFSLPNEAEPFSRPDFTNDPGNTFDSYPKYPRYPPKQESEADSAEFIPENDLAPEEFQGEIEYNPSLEDGSVDHHEEQTVEVCQQCLAAGVESLLQDADAGQPNERALTDMIVQRLILDPPEYGGFRRECPLCNRLLNPGSRYESTPGYEVPPQRIFSGQDNNSLEARIFITSRVGMGEKYYDLDQDLEDCRWEIIEQRRSDALKEYENDIENIGSSTGVDWRMYTAYGIVWDGSRQDEGNFDAVRVIPEQPHYKELRHWLDVCQATHPQCATAYSDALKTIRLIDVETSCLVAYSGGKNTSCDYVALSYVWGAPKQPLVTSLGPLPAKLPQTISDAMEVCRKLKFQYLWIDSICINQSDRTEVMSQVSIMDAIYEGAFATIIALDGTSSESGLPRVTSPPSIIQTFIEYGDGDVLLERLPPLTEIAAMSPWLRRGWTFQENILSKRRICFTKHQIYLSCNEAEWSEASGDVLVASSHPRLLQDPVARRDFARRATQHEIGLEVAISGFYEDLVNDYMIRSLTKQTDIINAFQGVLNLLTREHMKEGFLRGLPLEDFGASLLWQEQISVQSVRCAESGMPSWTWAGYQFGGQLRNIGTISLGRVTVEPYDNKKVASQNIHALPCHLEIRTMNGARVLESSSNHPILDYEPTFVASKKENLLLEHIALAISKTRAVFDVLPDHQVSLLQQTATDDYHLQIGGVLFKIPCVQNVSIKSVYANYWSKSCVTGCIWEHQHLHDILLIRMIVTLSDDQTATLELHGLSLNWTPAFPYASRDGVVKINVELDQVDKFWEMVEPRLACLVLE